MTPDYKEIALSKIKPLGEKEVRVFALIGGEDKLLSFDESDNIRVLFRGQPTSFSVKSLRKTHGRYYVSQVTIESRAGRDPSHLFAKKPQTDRER